MRDLNDPEPRPELTSGTPIWDLVIVDMKARDDHGRLMYNGTPLQARNGRDPLVDAYQEALDLAVYLRQAIEEAKGPPCPSALEASIDDPEERDRLKEKLREMDG